MNRFYKKNPPAISILLILLFLFFLSGCGKTPLEKYNEAVENYIQTGEGRKAVESAFFKAFGYEKPGDEVLFFNKRVILNSAGDSISIVFPEEITVKLDENIKGNIEFADSGEDLVVLGNSGGFYVFDKNGRYSGSYAADDKKKIDALAVAGDSVLFLKDHIIYSYNPQDNSAKRISEDTFPPPYRIYYKADIAVQGDFAAVITGIAGSYYISAINISTGSVLIKNIAASSFEFVLTEDEIICIRGTSGKWSLNRYEYKVKRNEKIKPLGNLIGIYLTDKGYALEREDEIIISDYDNNSIKVPFDCRISGRCRNSLIIGYGNNNYIIDFSLFLEEITGLKEKIPGFAD